LMSGWFRKTVLDPSLWITLVISILIALFGNETILRSVSQSVGSAQVQIGTAFLGIVLAGLALLVVFLDKRYIALLAKVPPGFDADLWPFKYTAFIAVICSGFGMILIIIGDPRTLLFRFTFGFSLWSFSYLLWTMFQLVRFLSEHAKTRVTQIQKEQDLGQR
ncbi:MAG: hypothetical protein AABZ77_01850, partial [Chloroflexota bacterium]